MLFGTEDTTYLVQCLSHTTKNKLEGGILIQNSEEAHATSY